MLLRVLLSSGSCASSGFRHAKSLRDLLITWFMFPPGQRSLLALVIFIYSVLGQQLFTFVYYDGEGTSAGLNSAQLWTFGNAFLLFQCLTADGWSAIRPCNDDESTVCSESAGTVPQQQFHFYFIPSVWILRLSQSCCRRHPRELDAAQSTLTLSRSLTLEIFSEAAEFDPDATNFIAVTQLPRCC